MLRAWCIGCERQCEAWRQRDGWGAEPLVGGVVLLWEGGGCAQREQGSSEARGIKRLMRELVTVLPTSSRAPLMFASTHTSGKRCALSKYCRW